MARFAKRLPHGLELVGETVVRKEANYSRLESLRFIEKLANYFIACPDPTVVPIYHFEKLPRYGGIYPYSYDMMRLAMLSKDEKFLIDEMAKEWYHWHNLSTVHDHLPLIKVDYPKLVSFISDVIQAGRYRDLHSGNFMLDLEGNYRIIDIEGFHREGVELNDPRNDWFMKAKVK